MQVEKSRTHKQLTLQAVTQTLFRQPFVESIEGAEQDISRLDKECNEHSEVRERLLLDIGTCLYNGGVRILSLSNTG